MSLKDNNKNLQNYIKEYWWLILLIIVGLPFVLHTLFKLRSPIPFLIAEWSIGDMLIYCVSILQAAATIFAIVLTINYTKDSQEKERQHIIEDKKEERRKAIIPYLDSNFKEFVELTSNIDNKLIIMCSPTHASNIKSEKLKKFMEAYDSSIDFVLRKVARRDYEREHQVIEYSLRNIGYGYAFKICLEYENNAGSGVVKLIDPFKLAINGERLFVLIFSKEWLNGNMKEGIAGINEALIKLSYKYSDVDNTSDYSQEETIKFSIDENDTLSISSIEPLSGPEPIRR